MIRLRKYDNHLLLCMFWYRCLWINILYSKSLAINNLQFYETKRKISLERDFLKMNCTDTETGFFWNNQHYVSIAAAETYANDCF